MVVENLLFWMPSIFVCSENHSATLKWTSWLTSIMTRIWKSIWLSKSVMMNTKLCVDWNQHFLSLKRMASPLMLCLPRNWIRAKLISCLVLMNACSKTLSVLLLRTTNHFSLWVLVTNELWLNQFSTLTFWVKWVKKSRNAIHLTSPNSV